MKIYLNINSDDEPIELNVNSIIVDEINKQPKSNYIKFDDRNNLYIKHDFFTLNVPNVYRYKIKFEPSPKLYRFKNKINSFKNSIYNDRTLDYDHNLPNILLILESPHNHEFKYTKSKLLPTAPAQKYTGKYIKNKIIDLINKIKEKLTLDEPTYRLIIINPVPYQTSMHFLHSMPIKSCFLTLRNNVWKKIWDNNKQIKKQFKSLINSLKPKLIINSCTCKLKIVINELLESIYKSMFVSVNHPSAWMRHGYNIKFINTK